MTQQALTLIQECLENKIDTLDLGNCGLSDLADIPELFKCTHITTLILSSEWEVFEKKGWVRKTSSNSGVQNHISALSEQITTLKNLNALICCGMYYESWSISDISFLEELTNLESLYLSNNTISDYSFLENLKNIQALYISKNNIIGIHFLEKLTNVQLLDLSSNQISDYSFLEKLRNLHSLNLSSNQISDYSFLEKLRNLHSLNLSFNQISDISFLEKLTCLKSLYLRSNGFHNYAVMEKLVNIESLDLSSNKIPDISFLENLTNVETLYLSNNHIIGIHFLENLTKLQSLDISNNKIIDISILQKLAKIKSLDLSSNQISDYSCLKKLTNLESLYLSNNQIHDYNFLKKLRNLQSLGLGNNKISDISVLENLTRLQSLSLYSNDISDISVLGKLRSLQSLSLGYNKISDISALEKLTNLQRLILDYNEISDVSVLEKLLNLQLLHISDNQISDINVFEKLTNLQSLSISNNPLVKEHTLTLEPDENHLGIIRTTLLRQREEGKKITLPVKILLLGNHQSGKTSLLHYLQHQSFKSSHKSTHVLSIEAYPVSKDNELPAALFYDFGGQDYYHGIYRVFLSRKALYLLLWEKNTNKNTLREDSNNIMTHDFDVLYWLGQKDYFENQSESQDPLLLIQSHVDSPSRQELDLSVCNNTVTNCFHVSLSKKSNSELNQKVLAYLQAQIDALIQYNQHVKEEPSWYAKFLDHIYTKHKTDEYEAVKVDSLLELYTLKNVRDDERINHLKTELQQLHQQGIVLYYPDVNSDLVWLNPGALTRYIHKKILTKKAIVKSRGIIPVESFNTFDSNIVSLLEKQKVIFRHKFGESGKHEYIIPNYLPLKEDNPMEYDLVTFGLDEPDFIVKFGSFLPMGLINQLICHFGKLHDKKKFWRDRLLFTLEQGSKVLIHLDFSSLEIKVVLSSQSDTIRANHIRYIFYVILGLYWDFELLEPEDFFHKDRGKKEKRDIDHKSDPWEKRELLYDDRKYRPKDMSISLDNKYFVNYQNLCAINDETRITAHTLREEKERSKEIPVYPFQPFRRKKLSKVKKVFISYSHSDIAEKKELQKFLTNLEREGIIEIWQDSLIETGEDWNEKILQALIAADIVIMLISQDFIASTYIYEVEMKIALQKVSEGSGRIFPILIKNCDWAKWRILPEAYNKTSIEENQGKMGTYQFFPIDDEQQRLKPVNRWVYAEDVWVKVADELRSL